MSAADGTGAVRKPPPITQHGRDTARIVGEVTNLLENPEEYERMAQRVSAYGDGNATGRVVEAISEFLNIKERENTKS